MYKRDYIREILEKKQRLSPDSQRLQQIWERISRLKKVKTFLYQLEPNSDLMGIVEEKVEDIGYRYSPLEDFAREYHEIQYEAVRYIPIGLVACMEGYFRLAYADLINFGPPYRDNAAKFDVKFSIETAMSLQKHALSLGEFVAHLLTTNNLGDINRNLSMIIGDDFLKIFRDMRPKLETQHSLFERDDEEISNWVLGNVESQFNLRHIFCHEPDPPVTKDDMYAIYSGMEAVREFLWVSDAIINEKVS